MNKYDSRRDRKTKPAPRRGPGAARGKAEDAAAVQTLSPLEALAAGKADGRVKFDDRGNAIWEWAGTPGALANAAHPDASRDGATPTRVARLDPPSLSLAEDAPSPFDTVKANPLGVLKGYNPYDSGKLAKPAKPATSRKKDLRKLSEWVKLRKQFDAKKNGAE